MQSYVSVHPRAPPYIVTYDVHTCHAYVYLYKSLLLQQGQYWPLLIFNQITKMMVRVCVSVNCLHVYFICIIRNVFITMQGLNYFRSVSVCVSYVRKCVNDVTRCGSFKQNAYIVRIFFAYGITSLNFTSWNSMRGVQKDPKECAKHFITSQRIFYAYFVIQPFLILTSPSQVGAHMWKKRWRKVWILVERMEIEIKGVVRGVFHFYVLYAPFPLFFGFPERPLKGGVNVNTN